MGHSTKQTEGGRYAKGIQPARLTDGELKDNFGDIAPGLGGHEALVAADRCYFCYDAPCMTACPTAIDVPLFIRQISTGTPQAAAKTILDQNILGGMCARVCPTEVLCEQACVREAAEGKPVEIGRLQRFATDTLMDQGIHPFTRAQPTGKRVAVAGAGPAGLSAAHRLAMRGHGVTVFEARQKAGGLNEFGIAAYKTVDGFAQKELDWLLKIGGIDIRYGQRLCHEEEGDNQAGQHRLSALSRAYDAVFLAPGLGDTNTPDAVLNAPQGLVTDAVGFIENLRQAKDLAEVPVGRDVVVIGGGMTAVDAAVQARLLGAETVSLVYRRGKEQMSASKHEQEFAAAAGVRLITNATPHSITATPAGAAVRFAYTHSGGGSETFDLAADQVLLAIGQRLDFESAGIDVKNGKICVTGPGRTSKPGVWAGGDCSRWAPRWEQNGVSGADDLTVTAVAEGRDAADDIHTFLMKAKG